MKKRIIILVGIISVICIIIIVVAVSSHSKTKPVTSPTPSPESQFNVGTPSSMELPDDMKYAQALTSLNEQYPWYSKLPIETKDYRIVYDFDKKMFRIRFLSSITSVQIKALTQNALNSLKKIGVSEPIKYYLLDASGNQL
jgi:hypothetical protein